MKRRELIGLCCIGACIVTSCSLSYRLRSNPRANVSLPVKPQTTEPKVAAQPKVVEFTDKDGNKKIVMESQRNNEGEDELFVNLGEVTVVAKSKSVPERFGKVDVDFVVSVPERLIHRDWQLTLTPRLLKREQQIPFDALVIRGGGFAKRQERGYRRYAEYLTGIIPDSLFEKKLVNMRAYQKELTAYDLLESRLIRKDSLKRLDYFTYRSALEERYRLFNQKGIRSREWLAKVLGFGEIKKRYEVFNQDTTHVSYFYGKRYQEWVRLIPQFHLWRNWEDTRLPSKYKSRQWMEQAPRTYRQLTPQDSVRIRQKHYRYRQIVHNERLKAEKEAKFSEWVQFPKHPSARLDTVIYAKGKFDYYYHQELVTDEDSKRMRLFLEGEVTSKGGNKQLLPASDTLSYVVSSMIQFLDLAPRFQRRIIERKATSSIKAYITFPVGKTQLDADLGTNVTELEKVQEMVTQLTETGEFVMDSIVLVAKSSPEGSFQSNMELSKLRGQSIKKYLLTQLEEIEGIDTLLITRHKGEDWEGFYRLVHQADDIREKEKIMEVIGSSVSPDRKEAALRGQFVSDYTTIRKTIYPYLRAVDFSFHVHRRGMLKDTIHTTEPDTLYATAIRLMQERKYGQALGLLSEYNDRNTAICLMSLGYDERAYPILRQEPEDGDTQYLLAILSARLGKEEEAVKYYLRACELDDSKHWRGALDPEINRLIKAYRLNKDEN